MEAVVFQWERIEAHMDEHFSNITPSQSSFNTEQDDALPRPSPPFLNPGATEDEILVAEMALGFRFPEDFRASLKRHNGQANNHTLIGMGPLLSTEDIVSQWTIWKELLDDDTFDDVHSDPDPGVKAVWWNLRWIPITYDGAGDHDCIDMDPAEGGTVGQIIEMWHDDSGRPLRSPSFLAWLTACASDLEDGVLIWDNDCGFVQKEVDTQTSLPQKPQGLQTI